MACSILNKIITSNIFGAPETISYAIKNPWASLTDMRTLPQETYLRCVGRRILLMKNKAKKSPKEAFNVVVVSLAILIYLAFPIPRPYREKE